MKNLLQETWQQISLEEVKNHLDLVANALAERDDVSVLLSRRGDRVFVYYHKRYSGEVNDILEESRREYQRKQNEGYSREQAFTDFIEAQREINEYFH